MKRTRVLAGLLVLAAVAATWPERAGAVPVFARKYGFNCTMCHSGFPRLNDFGQRFRNYGYRVPGQQAMETTVMEGPAPVALRTTPGYNYQSFTDTPAAATLNRFQVNGLDLLSAGALGKRTAFFFVYTPKIETAQGLVEQPGSIESALLNFGLLENGRLEMRLGRLEPASSPFSSKRRLTASPYEIYEFGFPGGPILSDNQTGLELTSSLKSGFRVAAGWLNGSATNISKDVPADVYLRLARVFGPGEGQTAGQRIGLMGYAGMARPAAGPLWDAAPNPLAARERFFRYGVDASFNVRQWNLALQWLLGRDNKNLWVTGSDVDLSGGFAELTFFPMTSVSAFARFDAVLVPSALEKHVDASMQRQDISRITVGGRFYLEDHLALHGEYSHRQLKSGVTGVDAPKEDFLTARADFAF